MRRLCLREMVRGFEKIFAWECVLVRERVRGFEKTVCLREGEPQDLGCFEKTLKIL